MTGETHFDRRTVLKGTFAATLAALGARPLSRRVGAETDRSFVVEQGETRFTITALSNGESVESFYDYYAAESHTSTGIERNDTSLLFLYDGPDGTSLVAIHDKGSGPGGGAVSFDITGLSSSGQWVVLDDSSDIKATDTSPDWRWKSTKTDGGAWRGGLDGDFEVTIDPAFNDEAEENPISPGSIDDWQVLSGDASDPKRTSVSLDESLTIQPGEAANISIKPGGGKNPINPKSRGKIPVAILGDDGFDPSTVDVSTVRFGDPEDVDEGDGATPAHNGHVEDVDGDGTDDLMLHFPTRDAGFDGDESTAKLVAETSDGTPVVGSDSVTIVGK